VPGPMHSIHVRDLDRLRTVLEDPELYHAYRGLAGFDVVDAELLMYPHPDGCTIDGRGGRWWVFLRLRGEQGEVYDAALWKLLRIPVVRRAAGDAVAVRGERGREAEAL